MTPGNDCPLCGHKAELSDAHVAAYEHAVKCSQQTQDAISSVLDAFIDDLDRECDFTAYAPTVRAVQAAKKLALSLPARLKKFAKMRYLHTMLRVSELA